jgi:hypothetical protein
MYLFERKDVVVGIYLCLCFFMRVVKRNQSMRCLFGGHGNGAKPKVTRFRRAVRKRLGFHDTT